MFSCVSNVNKNISFQKDNEQNILKDKSKTFNKNAIGILSALAIASVSAYLLVKNKHAKPLTLNVEELASNIEKSFCKKNSIKDNLTKNNLPVIYKESISISGQMERTPVEIVVKGVRQADSDNIVYKFYDGDIEVGQVELREIFSKSRPKHSSEYNLPQFILDDYPEIGLNGDRVYVERLNNYSVENPIGVRLQTKYHGIGDFADKVAVMHCIEHGIKPNVVSYSVNGSYIYLFKRGKRFFSNQGHNLNKEIAEYIDKNPNASQKEAQQTLNYNQFSFATGQYMTPQCYSYMPNDMKTKILKDIEENPINVKIV